MDAKEMLQKLAGKFGSAILSSNSQCGDATVVVAAGTYVELCRFLRDDPEFAFNLFLDLTVVDRLHLPNPTPRFEVVTHLRSMTYNHLIRVKLFVEEEQPHAPTLVEVYPAANWFEREAWDMYGVVFDGHPDLRRILMYDEFEGHPLRKDYPVNRQQPLVPHREAWTPPIAWKPEERWDQYAGDRRESPA